MSTTTTRRHEGRYTIGKRDNDGRYPVYVDGADTPTGYVKKMGHSAQPWRAEGGDDYAGSFPDGRAARWQACERIVDLKDARDQADAETQRRRERATMAPEGWRFASWAEIEREGWRTVRTVARAPYVDPAAKGDRYPDTFASPVVLRCVTRLSNGHMVVSGDDGSDTPWVTGGGPAWVALGVLVPEGAPERSANAPAGPVWQVGDLLSHDATGADGVTDTHTGTVTETRTHLDTAERHVSVAFPHWSGSHHFTEPSALRAATGPYQRDAEVVGGWSVGAEAVSVTYGPTGAPFARHGVVVGFSTDPETGARMVRVTSSPVLGAIPHAPEELYRPGDPRGWTPRPDLATA
ncbi:hypothetical protein [Streptomyces olivaceoviridis]|uniref:hypothetical protein n=1 Tax=Streptomyces olivaceoviridis TaxID=1921 RepID=UPI0033197EE1